MRFIVTEKHIAEGKPQDSSSCAIACMFKEVFNTDNVSIEDAYMMLVDGKHVELCVSDIEKVDKFINHFDSNIRLNDFVYPGFEFEAELVTVEDERDFE